MADDKSPVLIDDRKSGHDIALEVSKSWLIVI